MTERFSASSAARIMQCPGSANLEMAIPNWVPPIDDPKKFKAAPAGTRLHEVLAEVAELGAKEMKNFSRALDYISNVMALRRFTRYIEATWEAAWLDSKPQTTADLVLATKDELHIIDYKHGKIPVEVMGNKQLLFYGATYAELAPRAKGVTVHIVQPAADNMEKWYVTADELAEFMQDARDAETKVLQGSTLLHPGDACTFCPANPHSRGPKGRPKCPAMMKLLYPSVGLDEDEILKEDE